MEIINLPISQLSVPGWYGTENDLRKFANLKSSLRMFGQVRPIIIQKDLTLFDETNPSPNFNIVEGRRIYLALLEMNVKTVACKVVDGDARFINMMLNTINFDICNIGFSEMVSEVKKEMPVYSLCNYIPFSAEVLKGYDRLHNFDWADYDKEADSLKQVDMFAELDNLNANGGEQGQP